MVFILIFACVGCNITKYPQSESEESSPALSESEELESEEPLVQMQEIQPSGTVNLAEELSLFSSLLDNNYINVNGTVSYNGYDYALKLNARRTEKGYDAIIDIKVNGATYAWRLYYVDGVEIRGVARDGVNFEYMQASNRSFVDLIARLNLEINSSTETKLLYHAIKPILHKYVEVKELSFSEDLKDDYQNAIALLAKYRSRSIYDFVLEEILKVDTASEEASAKVKADILEFCSGNTSVAVFIDKIEGYINTKLSQENKINIKEYLNDLQARSGITTQEFVEMARERFSMISANLRDADEGESLYDYVRSYFRVISLNTFAKSVLKTDKTFVEYVDELIESSKQITVEYAYNWIVSNYFKITSDDEGNVVIGDHLSKIITNPIAFTKLFIGCEVGVDKKGRPSKIKGEICYEYPSSQVDVSWGNKYAIDLTVDYSNESVDFKIPQEIIL